jgi:hypothetical protein
MTGTKPSLQTIATAYGITRQAVHELARRHGLSREELANPDLVFQHMLTVRSSNLRIRLSDPRQRESIRKSLSN